MIDYNDNIDNRLQAFYASPAHDRVCECIVAMHLLYGAAMEYEQEIEVLLEHYCLYHGDIERASARLDKAFDAMDTTVRGLLRDNSAPPLNVTGDMLRRWMEKRIGEGLPTKEEEVAP